TSHILHHPVHQLLGVGQLRICYGSQEGIVELAATLAMVVTGQRQRQAFTCCMHKSREQGLGKRAAKIIPECWQSRRNMSSRTDKVKITHSIGCTVRTSKS